MARLKRKSINQNSGPVLSPVDFLYRRLTGDQTGFAPVSKEYEDGLRNR